LPTLLAAGAMALACAVLLLATSSRMAIVWDEGDTIFRAEELERLGTPDEQGAALGFWQAARSTEHWPYTIVREGHPPLSGILVALGRQIAPAWLDPLTQERFGPILFFSLGIGAMFYRLQRSYGVLAVSLVAVGALLMMPRLFAHAHYATLDGPLTAAWLLTWAAFAPAARDGRWTRLFGAMLGLAMAAKFTGWLVPLPFLAWSLVYRNRGGWRALAVGVPIALALFVLLNPPLWSEPIAGLRM